MSYKIHSLEFKLALSCSALDVERALDLSTQLKNSPGFSETDFLIFLRRHHICELAFHSLKENSFFSNSFQLQLELQSKANQLKAIKGQSIQLNLQSYFDEHHIYAIFLKGILLSRQYYGDIGLRNVVDIDVWVDEEVFNQVKLFLQSLGYVSVLDHHSFSQQQLNYIHQCNHDEIFYSAADNTAPVIELHWKLRNSLGNFMFDPNKDQENLMQVELNGVAFSVFNHVDQFIFLCVHGAEHGWFKLKWLVDLVHMNKAVDFDWDYVVNRAKALRSQRELRLAWSLLEEFYDLAIPEMIAKVKLTSTDKLRLNYVKHLITYKGAFCDTGKEKLLNLFYTLSLNRRTFFAKELVLKNLTNTTDWLTLPLSSSLFFLYFPLRPFLWVYRKFKS
jgi:hypothetical protein